MGDRSLDAFLSLLYAEHGRAAACVHLCEANTWHGHSTSIIYTTHMTTHTPHLCMWYHNVTYTLHTMHAYTTQHITCVHTWHTTCMQTAQYIPYTQNTPCTRILGPNRDTAGKDGPINGQHTLSVKDTPKCGSNKTFETPTLHHPVPPSEDEAFLRVFLPRTKGLQIPSLHVAGPRGEDWVCHPNPCPARANFQLIPSELSFSPPK